MTRLRSFLAVLLFLAAPFAGAAASPLTPLYDAVAVSSTTTGTGPITLGSAISGAYFSFSTVPNLSTGGTGVTNGSTVRYIAVDGAAREIGHGVYNATAGTLTRVLDESTTGSLLNLDGSETIYLAPTAADLNELGSLPIAKPQGRLTLQSNTPVMTADVTGASTIYYAADEGDRYPWYDGQGWTTVQFPSQLSVTLDATNTTAGALFDVFAYVNAGTPVACYGPAWTNTRTRSAALMQLNGLWVNSASMPCRASSSTTYTVPADEGTYLGTFYATAAGQTGVACKPAAASGGADNFIGLWNAYNRVPVTCVDIQSATYDYATQTWTPANSTYTGFRVTFVDGLGQSPATCAYFTDVGTTSSSRYPFIGCDQNSTTATPAVASSTTNGTSAFTSLSSQENFAPVLGLNYYQAMQGGTNVAGSTVDWVGNGIGESLQVSTTW